MMRLLPLTLIFLLGACGTRSTSEAPGIITDTDGTILSTISSNIARVDANRLRRDIAQQAGVDEALISVNLAERPRREDDDDDMSVWLYQRMTLAITAPATVTIDGARAVAVTRFAHRVDGGETGMDISLNHPAATPTTAGQRYQIQAGDTLATIASVFYGSPQHWRLIADANPGLDPAALKPGTTLVIPPAP
ncbi:MAG: LysM peptidoglycan-binding domain-containing protein [Planctomycetota bacterium]